MGALCCHSKLTRGPDVQTSRRKTRAKVKLLLIGLDNAGKTSTVMHLLGRPLDSVVPTIGFSSMQMSAFKSFAVEIYDLGGGEKIRDIWPNYFALVHGVIYVLDSTDANRLSQVATLLEAIMKNELICQKPILILINKQDVESALEEAEISQQLNLSALANQYQCPTRMECTSATSNCERRGDKDAGIEAGYAWLVSTIVKNWSTLSPRVERETERQLQVERDVMDERFRRYRNTSVGAPNRAPEAPASGEREPSDKADSLLVPLRPIEELNNGKNARNDLSADQLDAFDETICNFKPIARTGGDNKIESPPDKRSVKSEVKSEGNQMQHVDKEEDAAQVAVESNEFAETNQLQFNSSLAHVSPRLSQRATRGDGEDEVNAATFTSSPSSPPSPSRPATDAKWTLTQQRNSTSLTKSRKKSFFSSKNKIVPVE